MPPKGPYAFEGVNGDLLHEVHQTFTGFLFGALGQNPRWTQGDLQIANDLPVRGGSAKTKMASRAFGVHEWLDERVKAKIEHFDYEVTVKRWANAISLKVDDLEDEDLNLGQYAMLINEMGDDFDEHRHSLFIDLINNGFAGTRGVAYDGQFFFDTDHPIPGSTQSNKLTAAFSSTSFYAAVKLMEEAKKPNGLNANLMPTHGIFPTALRATVEGVLDKQYDAAGATNLLYKRIKPIFDPRLSSATAWFLIDASKILKPFFTVNRKPVTPEMSHVNHFEEGVVHWGAYARYNASYGFYQTMVGSDGTT